MARYEQQQEEINKLEDFIRRFGYKATKAAQAQERQKMLDKILADKIEIPETLKKIHFSFPPAPHSGRLVLTAENIGKTYQPAGNEVLRDLNLVVENGDRLVVAGRNGAGKSTLLRIIAGQDKDFSGTFKLGAGVSAGYFSQDSAELMTGSVSILDMLESEAPLELIPKLRDMLGAFLFRGDDVYKAVNVLSGGEKSRLALLRLLLRPVNLLILDEPTNHLDMHSKDVLLDALKDFGGTVIFVSHDRGFIESLATRVLELTPCHSREFPGSYQYYMEQLEKESLAASGNLAENGNSAVKGKSSEKAVPEKISDGAESWESQKKLKAERRKLEREEERLMNEISALEEKKSQLEEELSKPEVYSDAAKSRKIQMEIDETDAKITETTAEWEKISEQL